MDPSNVTAPVSPENNASHRLGQTLMGTGALLVAGVLVFGALGISAEAGYAGVGPNFLPWVWWPSP